MKLKFNKPQVPNYVRTDKGLFDLADLDQEEFKEYLDVFCDALTVNREHRIKLRTQSD